MRAGGARVGVGELLAAHRALAAVDPASRAEAYFALRAALCSSRADYAASPRRSPWSSRRADAPEDPLEALGQIESAALPRIGIPMEQEASAILEDVPVPAAWSEEELLREKDFAEYTRRRARARAAAAGAARAPRAAAALAPHAADAPAPRRARPARDRARVAAPRRRAARAPLPRAGRAAAPARAGVRRLGLDGAVRADAAAVPAGQRRRARARRGVRVRHPAHARHARARRPRSGPRAGARRRPRRRLVGRHADRRRAGRAQPRARPPHRPRRRDRRRSPTAGTAATRTCWPPRWRACAAARTASCGSTRSPPTRATSRSTRGMQAALPHVDHLLPGNSIASLEALAELMEEGLS